jgi:formylglycine-generating enzyme required for sulfatase activity
MDKHSKINDLFQLAKEQPTEYSFDQAKERFVNSLDNSISKNKTKRQFLTTKKLIIMISSICTISLLAYLLIPNRIEKPKEIEKISVQKSNNISTKLIEKEAQLAKNNYSNSKSVEYDSIATNEISENIISENIIVPANDLNLKTPDTQNKRIPLVDDNFVDEYPFPKLTDDEIKANNRKKKQMLKELEKFDKDTYSYFPAGTFDYKGGKCSVQSFFIQTSEVSNLEYRTFLFDLLIQGRKDEFLKAKPDQNQWLNLPGGQNNKLKEYYFSHNSYDNYPVVNISREGAEMYCKWLITELLKTVKDKEKQKKYNDTRLPVRAEWEYAASSGGKYMTYPWGEKLLNPSNCFLANFKVSDTSLILDSIQCNSKSKTNSNSITTAEFVTGNYDILAHVKSYNPNFTGLYNMSGNAAEMVYETYTENGLMRVSNAPGTAGGSWQCDKNQIKIEGEDIYKGVITANPAIGFRVVMTHIGHF